MGKKLLKIHKVDLSNEPVQYHWYSVKTQFNYEQKAADNILKGAKGRGYGDYIVDVIVPIIESTEVVIDKDGNPKKKKKRTKVWGLDGYIWVKMILNTETWSIVRNATGVAGWLNAGGGGPQPLEDWEVANIREACGYAEEKPVVDFTGKVGDVVEIISGAMKGFEGKVTGIFEDKNIIKLENENGFKIEAEFHQVKTV